MSEAKKPSEKKFESHIEKYLLNDGYSRSVNEDYNKDLCLIKKDILEFIKNTQKKTLWY